MRSDGIPHEQFLQSILRNLPFMVFIKDAESLKFVELNLEGERIFGASREQVLGRTDHDFFPPDQADFFQSKDREVLREGRLIDIREEPINSAGVQRFLHTRKVPIFDREGRPRYLLGVAEDITERKAVEDANRRFRTIFEASPDLIMIGDPSGRLVYINAAGRRMLGFGLDEDVSSVVGFELHSPKAREDLKGFLAEAERDGLWRGETTFRRRDGTDFPVSQVIAVHRGSAGRILYYSTVVQDLSDLQRLNAEAAKAKTMEAAATLAAGTAHEFNNLHTVILMAVGFIRAQVGDRPDVEASVAEIIAACHHASELTRRLLAFARVERPSNPAVVSLNDLIRRDEAQLRSVLGEKIRLTCDLAPDLFFSAIDSDDFDQMAFCLAENARDALPTGGNVAIRTSNATFSQSNGVEMVPGQYACFSFNDDGEGMGEEVKSRLFEPFFTTKGRARGTGLGLAAMYGIVKRLSGFLRVKSAPGRGATFEIYLPSSCFMPGQRGQKAA